jgi:predicted ATPase
VRFAGTAPEEQQLAGYLRSRDMLLVMDNFEHVTAHAPLVSRLLACCPGLRTIATSRHRLGIREESVFDLSGMELPAVTSDDLERSDSTRLFMASARRAIPGFVPGSGDAASIVRICRMLEGLPLALELSAPWIRTISCRELEVELEKSLDLLESPGADLPGRQRNMQAVFEYSWSLLTPGERTALAGLAVFEGGFDREAALEVAGCDLGTLRRLCDRSLVRPRPGGGYSLHPLTRQQAVDRQGILEGGRDAIEERHSAYYCDLLRRLHPDTRSSRQTEVLDRVSLELPNLRKGALHAFRRGDRDRGTSFSKTISILFQLRSRFTEGLEFFREVGEAFESSGSPGDPGDAARTRVELLERRGTFLLLMGRCAEALPCLEDAVRVSQTIDDPILQALCCGGLGNACHVQGDLDGAEEQWCRALALARENGVAHSVSSLLCNIATVKKQKGLHEEALSLLSEAETLNRASGDPYITAVILSQMADLMEVSGDSAAAERKYRESLALRRTVGDLRGMSHTFQKLSGLVMHRSPAEAVELAREGLRHAESSGAVNRITCTRAQLARALASDGSLTEAWEVLAAAEAEAAGIGLPNVDRDCAEARAFLESLDRREG